MFGTILEDRNGLGPFFLSFSNKTSCSFQSNFAWDSITLLELHSEIVGSSLSTCKSSPSPKEIVAMNTRSTLKESSNSCTSNFSKATVTLIHNLEKMFVHTLLLFTKPPNKLQCTKHIQTPWLQKIIRMDSCLKVSGGFCSLQTSPTSESKMSHLCFRWRYCAGNPVGMGWVNLVTFRCGGDEMIKELKGLIFDHKILFAMCLLVFNLMWQVICHVVCHLMCQNVQRVSDDLILSVKLRNRWTHRETY